MAKFHDLIDSLGMGEDGLTAYPETFLTDLGVAYDEDFSIPASRIEVLEADLAAARQEIVALKAHNYELITAAPVEDSDDLNTDTDSDDNDNDEDDEDIDSLFGSDDKDEK